MPPNSVTGEVYCFPHRQLIFSFVRRVIYHSKGFWDYIPKSIPSVCTTVLKRIAGYHFYPKCLMLCINGFVSTSSTKYWNLFSNFEFVFELLAENRKIFKRITRREYWSKCNVFVYQYIWLDKLYKLMDFFFKFWNHVLT